ncbi:uncharacterized protein LOC131230911 isoform X2 [Magnolia sinica]|nr:uncharacterized protein LOC131230911 isoform X2 [Magnolia sinica]
MELEKNPSNGGNQKLPSPDLQNPIHGDEVDSSCSTPYVSAPSSPGRGGPSFFFSAPASPMHYILSSSASLSSPPPPSSSGDITVHSSAEFEFSSRLPPSTASPVGSMISADELFLNGQIRPMKLSSHLQRPQILAPLLDLEEEDEESKGSERSVERGRDLRLRSRSVHRRARSMSPMRKAPFQWQEEEEDGEDREIDRPDRKQAEEMDASTASTPSVSASTSRSSSGRGSKRWISLKDFLYRSKSEGRGNGKEKFWHTLSFSPSLREKKSPPSEATTGGEKEKGKCQMPPKKAVAGKATNGVRKRRGPAPSPHEMFYTANRAQAEEMKKKTFLPYRQGLLGCLGFNSKSYGALNGFTKTLNPVSSR